MTDLPAGKHDFIVRHTACLLTSFKHWTGSDLLDISGTAEEIAKAVFESPMIVVSHSIGDDPVLNYGNRAAMELWEINWEVLTRTPSRLTAEPVALEERAALLDEVTRNGYIGNYQGIRISSSGRRFRIEQAVVWNLLDDAGQHCGQAAAFEKWRYL